MPSNRDWTKWPRTIKLTSLHQQLQGKKMDSMVRPSNRDWTKLPTSRLHSWLAIWEAASDCGKNSVLAVIV
jgi:hypothetical protein